MPPATFASSRQLTVQRTEVRQRLDAFHKIDDAVLALLWLTLHNERCALKGFDWATTDRLHKKGMIGDPVNKSKSLILTDEGLERSQALFRDLFTRPPQ